MFYVTAKFYSDDFERKPICQLIRGRDQYILCVNWLWFDFEIIKYHKKSSQYP